MTKINRECEKLFSKIRYYIRTNGKCELFEFIKRQGFIDNNYKNYTYSYRYVKFINFLDNLDKETSLQGITKLEKEIIENHRLNMRLILNGERPLNYGLYDYGDEWDEDEYDEE